MKKQWMIPAALMLCTQAYAGDGHDRGKRCRESDMNGEWVAFQAEVLKNPHTGKCDFTAKNGFVEGSCDFTLPNANGLHFEGAATVREDCSVELTMDFAPAPFVSTFQLQLARDKQTFAGRWENTFGAIGPTNGVRK